MAQGDLYAREGDPERPLPKPDSDELHRLVPRRENQAVYEILYKRRENPPTMAEIRAFVETVIGVAHEQTDRRTRELRKYFDIRAVRQPGAGRESAPAYHLAGWNTRGTGGNRKKLSSKTEAIVYEAYGYRCAMCGRSPQRDGVRLVIDHKIPVDWGGTDDVDNLQVLCTEHNHGKQAHFGSFDQYGDAIRAAITYNEVHLRIGELLKALEGQELPVDLINLVAREENKGDPTRRLRELRDLGWGIGVRKRKEGKRTISYYRLLSSAPWPPEGPGAVIRQRERARRKHKLENDVED